jgi:serine/threonine-protein kinase HipA
VDFLVETFDLTREGSLRYRTPQSHFLSPHEAVPPQIRLAALLDASNRLAKDAEAKADLKYLLNAGSASLGGTRPKACVRDGNRLLLAKFPHPQDE